MEKTNLLISDIISVSNKCELNLAYKLIFNYDTIDNKFIFTFSEKSDRYMFIEDESDFVTNNLSELDFEFDLNNYNEKLLTSFLNLIENKVEMFKNEIEMTDRYKSYISSYNEQFKYLGYDSISFIEFLEQIKDIKKICILKNLHFYLSCNNNFTDIRSNFSQYNVKDKKHWQIDYIENRWKYTSDMTQYERLLNCIDVSKKILDSL